MAANRSPVYLDISYLPEISYRKVPTAMALINDPYIFVPTNPNAACFDSDHPTHPPRGRLILKVCSSREDKCGFEPMPLHCFPSKESSVRQGKASDEAAEAFPSSQGLNALPTDKCICGRRVLPILVLYATSQMSNLNTRKPGCTSMQCSTGDNGIR